MLKFHQVKSDLARVGVSIRRVAGEYRVAFTGVEMIRWYGAGKSPEDVAYYATDLVDALCTGMEMADHERDHELDSH